MRVLDVSLIPFELSAGNEKNLGKTCVCLSPLLLSAAIIAQWWHPVASVVALNHLYWVMHTVSYRCTLMAIKTASNVGVFVDCCFVYCRPGGRWGNTKHVVARYRHPVASGVAMDMPHWAMPSVLLRRTAMAFKTTGGQGAFVRYPQFCYQQ